tara:strand:+ start:346 stop:531 length:186 start_codon:yes stop_codon:yes gene_type:complete
MNEVEKNYVDFMSKDAVKIMQIRQKNPNISIQDAVEINKKEIEYRLRDIQEKMFHRYIKTY